MRVILHYIFGVILFLVGIYLTQYLAVYQREVFSQREPNFSINPVMWLLAVITWGLLSWSLIIFGCSFLLSVFIITPIIYLGGFLINYLIYSESNWVYRVVGISIFILAILCFIVLWYHFITMSPGADKEVDRAIGLHKTRE